MRTILYCLCLVPIILNAQEVIYFASAQNSNGRDIYALLNGEQLSKLTTRLGTGHYPHFNGPKLSPDGTTLVLQSDPDGHDRYTIWTMKVDGTNLKRITQKEGLYPNWSPDGKNIVFSGRRNGIWEILTIPSSGGSEKNISNNAELGKRPGWGATCSFHPNGESLVYSYVRENILFSYDFGTEAITQLSSNGSYTHPVYAKDGTIAVNRKVDKAYDLILIKDGKEEVIAETIVSYSAPDWYANDSKILFVGMVNGNQELFTIDLETRQETQLTNNNYFDAMPVAK